MTLGDMKAEIRRELQESAIQNSPLNNANDPFTLESIILRSSGVVAQRTEGLYGPRMTGLVAGQKDYCLPDIFKPKTAYILDSDGNWWPIGVVGSPGVMDQWTFAQWRNADAYSPQDPPFTMVFNGVNSITLFPTPSEDRAAAVAIEGYWKPVDCWQRASSGNALPLADDQECPLPVWMHDAVVADALYERARRNRDPFVQSQVPLWLRDRNSRLGAAVQAAAEYHTHMAPTWSTIGWWWAMYR